MKGGLLDQQTVDFLSRQKIALFVARNLSKRPKISWKMKKQKRSLCIIVISIIRTLWKRFYMCCLEVGIFQVLLMEALRSARLMYLRSWCITGSFDENTSLRLIIPRSWGILIFSVGFEWILSPDLKYRTFYFWKLVKFEKSATFQTFCFIPLSKHWIFYVIFM